MNAHLAAPGIRFREFRWEDIPALVDIRNRTQPDDPRTVEHQEYFEKTYPADNPRLRYAVVNADEKFIGVGACEQPIGFNAPGVYFMGIVIDPDWRRQGIAQALLTELVPYARQHGAEKLWSNCREDQDYSIRFLEQAGFHNFGLRFESMLDLTTFDERPFASAIDQVRAAGFEFTTLAAERLINPDADRLLYELDHETGLEVPWPGGVRMELTYAQFRQRLLDRPDCDPSAILIAKQREQWAGLTIVEFEKNQRAHTAMTGVRSTYRRQGLALALKLLSFRLMKERGCTQTITQNDTANPPILHLNEKLGYQKRPGNLMWSKPLTP
jgi:ribosomal protein S18 acetylase RimI-like enzyme